MWHINVQETNIDPSESLLASRVRDCYSTDDESEVIEETMLQDGIVCSSNICPWEMLYFLNCNYEGINSISMNNSCEDILKRVFRFYFPNGLPKSYKTLCSINHQSNWDEVVPVLYKLFMKHECNMWLKENLYLDYTCAEGKGIRTQRDIIWEYLDKQINDDNFAQYPKNHTLESAYMLAHKLDNWFQFLNEEASGQNGISCKNYACDSIEKTRGMMFSICSYLQIPIFYSGESNMDFTHDYVQDRKTSLDFRIKPDITLCIPMKVSSEPFGVIKVIGVSSLNESEGSVDSVKNNCDQCCSDPVVNIENDKSSLCSSVSKKKKHVLNQRECILKLKEGITDKRRTENNSIYHNTKAISIINNKLKCVGPQQCVKNPEKARKLLGELAIEMYGMLLYREVCLQEIVPVQTEQDILGGLGLFVSNEFIYISKLCHPRWLLSKTKWWNKQKDEKERKIGPTFSYGNDVYFNLKRPDDRLAFFCFLQHFYFIQKVERKALTAQN